MYDLRDIVRGAAGFTLGELLTGIVIFGILTAIAVPNFTRTLPGLRLGDAARQIATDLQHLRMKAIAQNTPYQVTFSSTSYVLQRCSGACMNDSGNIALPAGITVTAGASPQFVARGTAVSAVTVTLSNGSAQRYVCVKAVGRISIQDTVCS